jgi:hypothetical protein
MKRKSPINRIQFAIVLMFFTIIPLWAQELPPDVDDLTPPASIDGSLFTLLIAAVVLGYVFLNRKLKNNKL